MKKTFQYARSSGKIAVRLEDGRQVELPIFPGILKHPTEEQLRELLKKPTVARKYTDKALRVAAWQIIREFDAQWLRERIPKARLRPSRRAALEFLLN